MVCGSPGGRTLTCWPSIAIDVKNAGGAGHIVEMPSRDRDREAGYFLRSDGLRQRHAGNLERIGNVLRHRRENAADVDAALLGLPFPSQFLISG